MKEAVEVYNKEARLLGKPTQEIPAGYVAPEPDVPPTVTQAPKHTSSPNDQKKKSTPPSLDIPASEFHQILGGSM